MFLEAYIAFQQTLDALIEKKNLTKFNLNVWPTFSFTINYLWESGNKWVQKSSSSYISCQCFDLLNPFLVRVSILYPRFSGFSDGIKWIMFLLIFFSFNPFLINVPILYPLNTPENQRFFRSAPGVLPSAIAPTSQARSVHRCRPIFPNTDKTVIILLEMYTGMFVEPDSDRSSHFFVFTNLDEIAW